MLLFKPKKFVDKYLPVLTAEQLGKIEDLNLGMRFFVWFSRKEVKRLDEKLKERNQFNNRLSNTAGNNNLGIEYEKQGKVEDAVKVYEENILEGYAATHSYQRLMVIYHRQGKFEDEIRVIKKAIEIFTAANNARFEKVFNQPIYSNLKNALEIGRNTCTEVKDLQGQYIYIPYPVNKWQQRLERLYKKIKHPKIIM